MTKMGKREFTDRHKKVLAASAIALFVVLSIAVFWFVGRPLVQFLSEPERFREWVDEKGFLGRVAFVGMIVLQIFVAFIPGEPLEIGAGYAFGAVEGTLLCLIGGLIGGVVVFLFVRRFGVKAVEAFFSREKIDSLKFLQDSKRLNLLVLIIFLIPGTPKDILCYVVGLTHMKLSTWIPITTLGRIPSIITSTIGGDALGAGNHLFAGIVLGVTLLICLGGVLLYRRVSKQEKERQQREAEEQQGAGKDGAAGAPVLEQGAPQAAADEIETGTAAGTEEKEPEEKPQAGTGEEEPKAEEGRA